MRGAGMRGVDTSSRERRAASRVASQLDAVSISDPGLGWHESLQISATLSERTRRLGDERHAEGGGDAGDATGVVRTDEEKADEEGEGDRGIAARAACGILRGEASSVSEIMASALEPTSGGIASAIGFEGRSGWVRAALSVARGVVGASFDSRATGGVGDGMGDALQLVV